MRFSDCREQDVLTIVMSDGEVVGGSYLTQAGMHFLSIRNPDSMLLKKVIGPFTDDDVRSIKCVKGREEILEERHARLRGERVAGRDPVTREDYEYRLETLARAAAAAQSTRRDQIVRQFDDVADRISLAQCKRQWLLAAGRWSLKSNSPPSLPDLWMSDVASPSYIARPRPQDFDPDPSERRRRIPAPPEALSDPRSVPNVLKAMRAAGLKAAISLAGDPAWERAVVQIDLGPGRTMRYLAEARRGAGGQIEWDLKWGGNFSKPGLRKMRQSVKLDTYHELKRIVAQANSGDLPAHLQITEEACP